MKVIAYYLPQFHCIPENDEMWGKGFTEWTNLRNAKPLFDGHNQPRVPLNDNYYNLLDDDVKKWQVGLANKYGIYGFCFYHYWFNGKQLLEKPVIQFLKNKELDIHFCLSWANEPWTKAWVSKNDAVLYEQYYGREKEWQAHFAYLLPFFKDERYITRDGKPLFIIYRPEQIDCLNQMLDYWTALAKENGLTGISFAFQHIDFEYAHNYDDSRFDYNIEYEPLYALDNLETKKKRFIQMLKTIDDISFKFTNHKLSEYYLKVRKIEYDSVWKSCIESGPRSKKSIGGAFIDWDNTPRRANKGVVYTGANPGKFENYFRKKINKIRTEYEVNDMIFLFSWNEWAEGGYLEPDTKYQYGYLESIEKVLKDER